MKIFKSLFILLAIIMGYTQGIQSQSLFENYKTKSIYLQAGSYYKNGVKKKNGFLLKNLKKELQISESASIEFAQYESKRNKGLLFYSLGLGLIVAEIAIKPENDIAKYSLWVAGGSMLLISLPLNIQSGNHFQRAIWRYNQDIL